MIEPPELIAARDHLARAESAFRSAEGLEHLEEGLELLEDVIADEHSRFHTLARNLASTYARKLYASVRQLLESYQGTLPEPDLEHLFRLVRVFDRAMCDLPPDARAIKISIARLLIDRYYEGYSPEQKREALRQLAGIAGVDDVPPESGT